MKHLTCVFALLLCALSFKAQSNAIPRPEYPRPQFERAEWVNLNGQWSYTFDFGKSGMNRKLYNSTGFADFITVPFCPESKLSGVEHKDFINAMWYHRTLNIPADWQGKKLLLHFGAVDYYATIYIDGIVAGRHWGGSSSFDIDITRFVDSGTIHQLVVYVEDDQRSGTQGKGKQSGNYYSQGCDYTRTTGIWQTVWMEAVDACGLKRARIIPELDQKRFVIEPEFYGLQAGQQVRVSIKEGDKTVCRQTQRAASPAVLTMPLKNIRTWSPESPFLYDIEFEVLAADGQVIDHVNSYADMRKVHTEGGRFFLNNRPYFQRLVLDQGFYPTGVWTAPTDADLKRDIELSQAAGFNGARLHQKVFEERFHYWADKLGYITWGESASWGMDTSNPETARNFLTEWGEIVVRDRNHPSILIWTPFNETWDRPDNNDQARQHDRFVSDIYKLSHQLDYRPVNDTSGNFHVVTDIWSVHHYAQSGEEMKKRLTPQNGKLTQKDLKKEVPYGGQPYFLDEFGGIKWVHGKPFAENTWGYGQGPQTLEEFYARLKDITFTVLTFDFIEGYCYTQLTDVEQEQNGIYNYDRTPKFDSALLRAIFSKEPERGKK